MAILMVAVLPVDAATEGQNFGTFVSKGDGDFIPVAKKDLSQAAAGVDSDKDNHRLKILRVPLGESGIVTDDVFIIDMENIQSGGAVANTVDFEDVYLTPFGDRAFGDFVQDADTTVKTPTPVAEPVTVMYADVDNDGKYKTADYVYLVRGTDVASGLLPTNSPTSWTIRLTETPSGVAGSFVFASDADFIAYQTAAKKLAVDATDATVPTTDNIAYTVDYEGAGIYLQFQKPAAAVAGGAVANTDAPRAGSIVTRYSLRLFDDAGSKVNSGAADFIPQAKGASSAIELMRKSLGEASLVTDDAFYFNVEGANTNVDFEDIRVTQGPGGAPGSYVQDTDTIEKGAAVLETVGIVYADVNNNGRYDRGDAVFIGQTGGAAITAATGLAATTGVDDFTIRLTPSGGKAAGSFVFASDSDFVSYSKAVSTTGVNFQIAEFEGAEYFLVPNLVAAAGATVPLFSIYAAEADDFGKQVVAADPNFRPTLRQQVGTFEVQDLLRVALGESQVTDDCFVFDFVNNAGNTADNFDLLATPCNGFAAGALLNDQDTVIKPNAVAAPNVFLVSADVDNDGKFKDKDYLYISTANNALNPTTSTTSFTIRLTETPAGPAGSFVFAGDSDFVSYQNAVSDQSANFALAFFDADLNGAPTQGDAFYLHYKGSDGGFVTRYSVRLHSDLAAPVVTPPSTTTTSTATSSTTTTTATVTQTTTATATGTQTTSDSQPTPGFELVALVAALGAALVLVRRRL